MTWTMLSDEFSDRPDLLNVSRSARLLHVEALIYCNKHATDGVLPRGALPRITDAPDALADVAELVAADVWQALDTAWQVDWRDQLSSDEVRARRANANERQERRRKHKAGDHSLCRPSYCPQAVTRDATRDGPRDQRVSHGVGHATPSLPTPPLPAPAGKGRGGTADTAPRKGPIRCPNGAIVIADGTCCEKCATPPMEAAS